MKRALINILSGTVVANFIVAASTPLLTRLYTPSQFAELALMMSWGAVLSILFGLRLDVALFETRTELGPQRIIRYQALLMRGYAVLLALLLLSLLTPMDDWVVWTGIYAVLLAASNFMLALAVREKYSSTNAVARVSRAGTLVVGQLSLAKLVSSGLMLGELIARFMTLGYLYHRLPSYKRYGRLNHNKKPLLISACSKLKHYVFTVVPQSLVNAANVQSLFLVAGVIINPQLTGALAVVYRVAMVPASIVAQAITHTTLDYVADTVRRGRKERVSQLLLRLLSILAFVGAVLFCLGYFVLESYGSLIFGSQWGNLASDFLLILPLCWVHFFASPFVALLNVLEQKRWLLIWDCSRLVTTMSIIIGLATWDHRMAVLGYSLSMSTFLVIALVKIFNNSSVKSSA